MTIARKAVLGALVVLALGVSVAGSYVLGFKRGLGMMTQPMQATVGATLSVDVEVASCIRIGDTERALKFLDGQIDRAILALNEWPRPPLGVMGQAKVYRTVVPSMGPSAAQVDAALKPVPPPEGPRYTAPERQRSGLGRLVTRSAG